MDRYDVGDAIVLYTTAPFTDADGVPLDASEIVCQVRRFLRPTDPLGTTAPAAETLSTTHDGTGLYSAVYAPTAWGTYGYRFALVGADGEQAADEAYFEVRSSPFVGT